MKTETDLTKRWEKGTPHHPESRVLYQYLELADWKLGSDYLHLKSGGDGDNGEHLMYLLDVLFEARDRGEAGKLDSLLREPKSP